MTGFEIAIPLVAFAVIGVGIAILKRDTRRIDAARMKHHGHHHPAE
jgi:mannose/fructose/N-acetylgalactosamine-specific phosphotransferase system component IIC